MIISKMVKSDSVSVIVRFDELFVLKFFRAATISGLDMVSKGKNINGAVYFPIIMSRKTFINFVKRLIMIKRTKRHQLAVLPFTNKVFSGIMESIKHYRRDNNE
jgi:hypothetical protein